MTHAELLDRAEALRAKLSQLFTAHLGQPFPLNLPEQHAQAREIIARWAAEEVLGQPVPPAADSTLPLALIEAA